MIGVMFYENPVRMVLGMVVGWFQNRFGDVPEEAGR